MAPPGKGFNVDEDDEGRVKRERCVFWDDFDSCERLDDDVAIDDVAAAVVVVVVVDTVLVLP